MGVVAVAAAATGGSLAGGALGVVAGSVLSVPAEAIRSDETRGSIAAVAPGLGVAGRSGRAIRAADSARVGLTAADPVAGMTAAVVLGAGAAEAAAALVASSRLERDAR